MADATVLEQAEQTEQSLQSYQQWQAARQTVPHCSLQKSPSEQLDELEKDLVLQPEQDSLSQKQHLKAIRRRMAAVEKALHFMERRQDIQISAPSEIHRHVCQHRWEVQAAKTAEARASAASEYQQYRQDALGMLFRQSCLAGCWQMLTMPRSM